MATISGYVEKIKYRNNENGYSVLNISSGKEEHILVGIFPYINEGDFLEASGELVRHPIYGNQIHMQEYEVRDPEDTVSMERYLGSGAIKGVGAALASRIIRKFKADAFRVIEEEPERLAEVKGISEKLAMSISEQMEEKKEVRQAMMFLQEYGISMNLALKIYQGYGPRLYGILKENPYRLAEDIQGIGFKMADEIARKIGIVADSDYRIRSGLLYCLQQSINNGHTYLPREELFQEAAALLQVDMGMMDKYLMDLQLDKKVIVKLGEERREQAENGISGMAPEGDPYTAKASEEMPSCHIYAASYYYTELNTARRLHDLNLHGSEPEEEIRAKAAELFEDVHIEPDESQIQAVVEAVNSGLLIITGGPGTGKTTTINTIIQYFMHEGMEFLLAAPTGRAAKRMTEATGYEARTIHRLLEPNGAPTEDDRTRPLKFERNEDNPLEADAVIIDEMSMVDIYLMHALLCAISPGTRLILVGDVNQLPSVGPGNVLRDIIDSGCFHVVRLTHIFRQAAESDIIVNAHKINGGEQIPLGKPSRDFLFIRLEQPDDIIRAMITLVQEKLPGYVNADPFDIQIMTPMRKGPLGVERLNSILQEHMNPKSPDKTEKEIGGMVYRVGDKVMQVKNNYQIEWELRNSYGDAVDSGLGIFNGDTGIIRDINLFSEELSVEFDEGRMVCYSFKQLEELDLAYAITVHKSQGSEYPAVVMPIYPGPRMLMTRNLIYTAVTRAKSCVCMVGIPRTFQEMVNNESEQRRYTGLKSRICEIGVQGA